MTVTYTILFGQQVDTGAGTAVTVRKEVFAAGMPSADPTTDDGVALSTALRPDIFNNLVLDPMAGQALGT